MSRESLLEPIDERMGRLMEMDASSAVVVGFAIPDAATLALPPGFGFLVPPGPDSLLLACTFVDQKFDRQGAGWRAAAAGFLWRQSGGAADAMRQRRDRCSGADGTGKNPGTPAGAADDGGSALAEESARSTQSDIWSGWPSCRTGRKD